MDLTSPAEFTDADERILRYLQETGADYPALVAGNTGLHVTLVERHIGLLEDGGYLEAVTGEAVYRTTEAGEAALEALDAPGAPDPAVGGEGPDAPVEESTATEE